MALAVLAISACGDGAEGIHATDCLEASYFEQKVVEHYVNEGPYMETLGEVHGESSVVKKEPNEKGICKAVLDLQENGSDTGMACQAFPYEKSICKAGMACQAFPYLQKEKEDEPNRNEKEECKAFLYLHVETEEPNKKSGCKATSLQHGTMYEAYDKYFDKLVKNDFATLCRSLEDYVMEIFDWWTLAFLNKVYKMMVALMKGIPAFETMLHYMKEINNIDYLVDKVYFDMVNLSALMNEMIPDYVNYKMMTWAWHSLCPAVAWLLSSRTSLAWHLWCSAGWMARGVAGQVFQHAVFGMLTMFLVALMAIYMRQKISRHVAVREHVSRICKRRQRRENSKSRRQLTAIIFLCSMTSAAAMEQDAVLQRIITLTEAATRAAMSAESTLNQVQTMTSSSTSGSAEGLQAASRILKAPDTFSGDDPMSFASWRFQFTSWLTFGDSRYSTLLEKVESLTAAPAISTYDAPEKELAHKLYAVLTSYLRGRCSHIIKAFSKSRDGFAIWYQLMREFEPTSRQRSLALSQALASYPVFAKDKSCLESILVYEQTVQQFEESSGTTYPDELKVATLMRCCTAKLREFLQLNIKEDATYNQVREHIMNYERVSKSWTQEQVLKSIQDTPKPNDGPVPMEIDRVEKGQWKGKGKGKDKGKGQYGGWESGFWGFGRGRGRGRDGKGKGKKGKGKDKGKGKGKGKSKNNKGKGQSKGKLQPNQCSLCRGFGHWRSNCPHQNKPMEVNQVQASYNPTQQQGFPPPPPVQQVPFPGQNSQQSGNPVYQAPVGTAATTASSSSYRPPSTSTGSTVRRIFHIGPPSPSSSPSNSTVRTGNAI